MVTTAYKRVNKSSKGRGIDNVSFADFEKEKSNNLYKIWNRMASGSYFPPPVKEVEIPKLGRNKMRVLGVGTIGDQKRYKRLKSKKQAIGLMKRIQRQQPNLFAHWKFGFKIANN